MTQPSSPAAFGDAETKFFYALTPDRILDAVESLGFRCTGRCNALNSMENRVYDVEIDDPKLDSRASRSERFRIVKFYRPGRWTREQILEEHRFLLDLVEYDIPVVAPLASDAGETLVKLPDIDIWCAVFPKVGGRSPDELEGGRLAQVGRLLARMHNVGATSEAPNRVKICAETYGLENLAFLLQSQTLPPHIESQYQDLVEEICEICGPWFEEFECQRIHGDCHLGNLLWGDQGPFWVDFDDMLRGPCVQDLWLMLPGRAEEVKPQLDILVDSYLQMREFDRESLCLIEPLRTLRIIHFDAWIAKRWSDPAFPNAFVEYGTERYWGEQIRQLEQQRDIIDEL